MCFKKVFSKKYIESIMKIFASILFIFSLSIVTSCFQLSMNESSSPIKVEVEQNDEIRGSKFKFTITNEGSNDLVFFDNDIPPQVLADGTTPWYNKQYFIITDENGNEVPYIGRYAYVMNTRSRWRELKSGDSEVFIVDLAGEYDFLNTGKYNISFVSSVMIEDESIFTQRDLSRYYDDVNPVDDSENFEDSISRIEDNDTTDVQEENIVSNEMEMGFDDAELDNVTRKKPPKPPAGGSCSASSFDKDKALAKTLSAGAVSNLYRAELEFLSRKKPPKPPAGGAGTAYVKWFGAEDTKRHALVKANFGKISTACGGKWTYTCPPAQECDGGVIAWVFKNKPNTTWLCPGYMKMAVKTKALVLLHEASHWTRTANTEDYGYGAAFCEGLAKKDPNKAVKNADSYFQFANGGK